MHEAETHAETQPETHGCTARPTGTALRLYAAALLLAPLAALGQSESGAAAALDPGEGEPIDPEAVGAVAACAVCHGVDGEGNPQLSAPRIGGMAEWYTARQLRHFRQGVRGGTDEDEYGRQMHAIALTLPSMEAADDLALYFSGLSPPPAPPTLSGDIERGEELYTVCTACHGEDGRGSQALNTPSMVEQYDWYLVRQLEYFKNGLRGTHPDDVYGRQMVPIMQTLPDRQAIVDVVAYINTL